MHTFMLGKMIWYLFYIILINDITQITLRSELLSQIRVSDVVLRDRIHRDSRITH